MKHYTKESGYELDVFHYRRCFGFSREMVRDTKRIYRGRERAALKRMTAELVADETGDDFDYWDDELERVMNEWEDLFAERACDNEDYEWYGADEPDEDWFAARFDELNRRIDVAYREWMAAA